MPEYTDGRGEKYATALPSARSQTFGESVIRWMSRVAAAHGAVNLAQGFPDFPAPEEVKAAACAAIEGDINQYAITWGAPTFREAIASKFERTYGVRIDPETEVCAATGATEALAAAVFSVVDPGDEVIVLEPFYENYGANVHMAGGIPRYVPLLEPEWTLDEKRLRAAFNGRTRAIIVNSPNNPTGRVFDVDELTAIADVCQRFGVIAITDEIYEHITYDRRPHIPLATLPGMEDRTITISALSKTYSVTGWRVGWAIAPQPLTAAIRKVHDFLTQGPAAPLQEAGAAALALPDGYYRHLLSDYHDRRDKMMEALGAAKIVAAPPEGAYYVFADTGSLGFGSDVDTAVCLARDAGVAAVPGSAFYSDPSRGRTRLRFAFCKRLETLDRASKNLARFAAQADGIASGDTQSLLESDVVRSRAPLR